MKVEFIPGIADEKKRPALNDRECNPEQLNNKGAADLKRQHA